MTRLTLALAVWMSLVSAASASLSPRKDSLFLDLEAPPVRAAKPSAQTPAQATEQQGARSEFVVTAGTEVLLNGNPCQYQDVPAHARIEHMEVSADRKTVLKIHFRTRK